MGKTITLLTLVAVLAVPGLVFAAEKSVFDKGPPEKGPLEQSLKAAEAKKVEPVVIRMYNVQDLLLGKDFPYRSGVLPATAISSYDAGQYAAAAGGGGQFGNLFGNTSQTNVGGPADLASALTPEVLQELIQRTVDSEPWADEGGRAKIDRVGPLLVVTQTVENHKKIAELLEQLRTARPMVTIEAKWVLIEDTQIGKVVPEAGPKRALPIEAPDAALAAAEAKTIYRGQITCFDRQVVHLASGRAQTLLTRLQPVVAEAAVGSDPEFTTLLWGALLEITTSLSADSKSATVNLHTLITEGKEMRTRAIAGGQVGGKSDKGDGGKGEQASTLVDLPEFLLHTFRTTVRVPLDKQVIVGGMTSPTATDGKVLYLVLQISSGK
jgi:hypothetical protein